MKTLIAQVAATYPMTMAEVAALKGLDLSVPGDLKTCTETHARWASHWADLVVEEARRSANRHAQYGEV